MKKCRYVTCHNDHHFYVCNRCGQLEYGRIPIVEEKAEEFCKRCPQCKALIKAPKGHMATKYGIIAVQGQYSDGIYLFNAHTKELIGHSLCHERKNARQLAKHIEVTVKFKKRFIKGR